MFAVYVHMSLPQPLQVKKLFPKTPSRIFDFKIFCSGPSEPFSSEGTDFTLHAPCDMGTDGGEWMVTSPAVTFYRSWGDYENGFEDQNREFWYGTSTASQLRKKWSFVLTW